MRCATCSSVNGCDHVSPVQQVQFEVEARKAPRVTEPAPQVYVPGVRIPSDSLANGGAENRGPSVVIGSRGEKGDKGDSVVGPPGPPGRDANVEECIEAAALTMQSELAKLQTFLR